eukprot:SAG11_NODE_729_length_7489_cov_17.662246_3_plen_310_part_00
MATAAQSAAIGLSGGVASCFARLLVYPLDVLRTVYVTKGAEGVRRLRATDLYRGLSLGMLDAFFFHAANFGVYEFLKGVYWRMLHAGRAPALGAPVPPLVGLVLGMASGAVGMVACYPFTTLILRMSSEQESLSVAAAHIIRQDGVAGLWRGLLAGLFLCPRPGLNFVVVELLQPLLVRLRSGRALTPGLTFLTGAIADVVSTSAVWPLAYARISLAVGQRNEDGAKAGVQQQGPVAGDGGSALGRIAEVIRTAVREHGVSRLYYGLKEEAVGLSLKGGLRWMVKPWFDAVALVAMGRLVLLLRRGGVR